MDGAPLRTILLALRYAVAGIGRQAVGVFLLPLYTLYLDPKDFGVLALLTISGTLVIRTVETPLGNALQRFYFRPDYRSRSGILVFNLSLVVAANLAAVLALYHLAAELIARFLFQDPTLGPTVRLWGFVVAFSITTSLSAILVTLLEQSRLYLVASMLNVIVTGVVSVALLAFARLGVAAVVLGQAAGLLIQTLVCLPAIWSVARPSLDWDSVREPLRFGYATLLSGYSNILIIAGDRYMLGLLATVRQVGLYSFGSNIGNAVTLAIGTPMISAIWPTIRRIEDRPDEQRAFIRRVTTFVCAAGVALAAGLSIFAPELIRLLASRPDFLAAAAVVPLLAFSQVLLGLAAFTEAGLVLGNKPAYVSGTAMASAIANIGFCFLLIPSFGLFGAAWATLGSFVLWNGLNLHYSAKFYRLRFDLRRLTHAVALGVLLVIAARFLPLNSSPWLLWPSKALLVAAYPLLLLATGFLQTAEWDLLVELARGARRRGLRGMMVTVTQP